MAEAIATTIVRTLAMEEIPVAAERVRQFTSGVVSAVDSVMETVEDTCSKDDKLRYTFDDAKTALKRFSKCGSTYADSVNDVFYFSTKIDKKRLRSEIYNDNYRLLNEILDNIQRYVSHAKESFVELEKASQKAKEVCASMAGACLKYARGAENKKTATQAIGGTGSAALLGGGLIAGGVGTGVALSVVAGVFTFGIGTAVGLGLTAAGAGTAVALGTTAAAVTVYAAKKFEAAHKRFSEYAEKLDEFYKEAVSLDEKVETELEMISKTAQDVRYHLDKNHKDSIKRSVNLLLEKFDKCYEQIKQKPEPKPKQKSEQKSERKPKKSKK